MTLMDLNLPALEMQTLFDALPDVVFFIKDSEGRYTHCNLTLVRRLGRKLRSGSSAARRWKCSRCRWAAAT